MLSYDIISVHQEHPKSVTIDDVKENVNYICKKYNNIYSIDMLLLCLSYVVPTDYQFINGVMADINQIHTKGQNYKILTIFLKILQTGLNICFNQDMGSKSVVQAEIFQDLLTIKKQLKDYRERWGMLYFPTVFSALVKSIFSIDL